MRLAQSYAFSLWEKAGMRAGGIQTMAVRVRYPSALTPALSQREREKNESMS
jgi:hypothetical protein